MIPASLSASDFAGCRCRADQAGLRRVIRLLVVLLLLAVSFPLFAHHQSYRIGLFTSRSADDAFWGPVEQFMRAACNDLGMELQVFYAGGDHFSLIRQFEAAARSKPRFDALVLPNFKKTAHRNIKIAEALRVPVLLFNSGISAGRKAEMGRPREKYRYWIGSILPDERQVGADLLNWLLSETTVVTAEGARPIAMVALGGNLADFASTERILGLERALDGPVSGGRSRVRLAQLVHADWQRGRAEAMSRRLLRRYPDTRVAWAASDLMALGVLDAARSAGASVITGGVDWTREGLNSVLNGGLRVSFGGHFMDGGWAAVMLYDYFHGVDFANDSLSLLTPMEPLSAENRDEIRLLLSTDAWEQVDFKLFSKALNPGLSRYSFSPHSIFSQLR